jgi:hypothetical protein
MPRSTSGCGTKAGSLDLIGLVGLFGMEEVPHPRPIIV